jgi:hypothetical protein
MLRTLDFPMIICDMPKIWYANVFVICIDGRRFSFTNRTGASMFSAWKLHQGKLLGSKLYLLLLFKHTWPLHVFGMLLILIVTGRNFGFESESFNLKG